MFIYRKAIAVHASGPTILKFSLFGIIKRGHIFWDISYKDKSDYRAPRNRVLKFCTSNHLINVVRINKGLAVNRWDFQSEYGTSHIMYL